MGDSPEIVVIAAVAEAPGDPADRLIGRGMELPWHLPADLRRFKALTEGWPLVMGRRTFESLLYQFGGPLPNRENVVLTRHPSQVDHPGIHVYPGLKEAVEAFSDRERLFIGGGAGVYETVLRDDGPVRADRLELTLVEGVFEGDTFFPPYRHLLDENGGPFCRLDRQSHEAEEGHPSFRFDTYVRF